MATSQPASGDKLNNPDHSLLHRIIASDTSAPVKSIEVDSSGALVGGTPLFQNINPTNLLSNGDFENWSAGISGDGWLSSTVLVANFDGADEATAFTAATGQVATFVGTAQLDTAQKKFGSASLLLDGNSDYITFPDNASWNFGTGNFTIEFWVYFLSLPASPTYVCFYTQCTTNNNNVVYLRLKNTSGTYAWQFEQYNGGFNVQVSANSPGLSTGQWYHIALTKASNIYRVFQNGTQCGTDAEDDTAIGDYTSVITIGAYNYLTGVEGYVNGYIDEVHIYKGVAKYTANFTPETAAYTTDDWNAPDGWENGDGTVAREATIIKIGTYSAKVTRAGSNTYLKQGQSPAFPNTTYFRGRTITFSCWVYATVADRARITVLDNGGTTASSYHTGNSTWQKLTLTKTVNADATYLIFYLEVNTGDTSAYFDGAMLVEGSSAFAFSPKPLDASAQIVAEVDETKFSHKLPVVINGSTYYIMLTNS